MTASEPGQVAERLIRVLLDPGSERPSDGGEDWGRLEALARRNRVLVRLADRLASAGVRVPARFAAAVERERERATELLRVMRSVEEICAAALVEFLFPKALQHYPDMGGDLDLIVLSPFPVLDRALVEKLHAAPLRRGVGERIAGRATYDLGGGRAVLDVHHARLGQVGEYADYPRLLIRRSREISVGGATFLAPSREDQLILQGVERVGGRRSVRIAELLLTISLLRAGVDWDDVIGNARKIGALHALCGYLSYVDQVHRQFLESPLLEPATARLLPLHGWGRMRFRGELYRLPAWRASTRVYAARLGAEMASLRWTNVARLGLLPVVAASGIVRRLGVRGHPSSPRSPGARIGPSPDRA